MAESKVTISLKDKESLQEYLYQLEESDKRLRIGPSKPGYDWQFVFSETFPDGSSKVYFGVSWYDMEFFQEKKDSFSHQEHRSLFSRMAVNPTDISVEHWVKTT